MRKMMLMAFVAVAIAPAILAVPPFGDGFATGKMEDYLEKVVPEQSKVELKKIEGVEGKSTLCITDSANAHFKAAAVSPETKYTLSFKGSFTGGESIEENPRFDVFVVPRKAHSILPCFEIEFVDAEMKNIPDKGAAGVGHGLPFRQPHDYVSIFYTPARAAFLLMRVRSAPGITFSINNITLEKTPDEGSINVNPDFKCGLYNYSGWEGRGLAEGAKMVMTKEGKPALDMKYGTASTRFPVTEPGTYQATSKFTPNGYNENTTVRFFDKDDKMTGDFGVRENTYFILPAGTVGGTFLVYSRVVEELRLIRVGDESKIEELRKK